jgi:drug/metabolite transporter (DMT)-like permease
VRRPAPALVGILLVLLAVACFATLDTTTKWVTRSVPMLIALWFRYFFQALVTTAVMLPLRGRSLLRTAHPRFQLLRGILLMLTSLFAFFSLKYMPVGEFTAIVMLTPLAITLVAATALGERVSGLRWSLVVGGFAGTVVIIRPGSETFDWTMLLPLGVLVCNAWFQLLTSKMAKTENPATMHFYTGWIGALMASAALPYFWVEINDWRLWAGMALMGATATVGHLALIMAYARAPAASLTPFLYGQIGFAMLGGWLVFDHVPDQWSAFGIVLIAICGAAGAWLTVHERRTAMLATDSC